MLLAGLPNGEWHDLNLSRKVIGNWEIAVALDEHAADNERRIVRRRNLRHPLRQWSSPVGAAHEVFAGLGSRGAFAHVGKNGVVRQISELNTVIAAAHVRYMQNLRPLAQV